MLEQMSLDVLAPAEDNIRRDVGDVTELAASIKAVGLVEPIVATPGPDGGYTVVAGARRYAAAKKAGLTEVPVRILGDLTPEQRVEVMLIENLQRVDLAPLEEAEGYRRLVELGWSQRKIAERIGRNQSHVSKRLALAELPDPARKVLDAGGITVADAIALTKLQKAAPDRVATALKEVKRYGGAGRMDRVVEVQIREVEHDRELAEVIERAKKDPAPYLAVTKDRYGSTQLPGVRLGDSYGGINLTPAKHRKFPCHAVTVDPGHGWNKPKLTYICTEPKTHPDEMGAGIRPIRGAGSKLSDAEKAERKAKRERKAALTEAQADRLEFVRALLAKKPSARLRDAALALLLRDWSERESGVPYSKIGVGAVQLLGIPMLTSSWGEVQPRTTVTRHLQANPEDLAKVALAVGIGSIEDAIDVANQWFPNAFGRVGPYFALLEEQGYAPSEAERAQLAESAPKPGEEDDEDLEPEEVQSFGVCRECGCTDTESCEGGCAWVTPDLCSACTPDGGAAFAEAQAEGDPFEDLDATFVGAQAGHPEPVAAAEAL